MSSDPFRLDGQLALVTGGSSGIGLATAEALIGAGARVVITGRNEEALDDARARLGASATVLRHDLAELDSIPPLINRIEREIGPLSILINNAGNHLKRPALDTSDADLARIMGTQVAGTFALSRECGRYMVERGAGSIIMIVSMAALFGIPLVSAYSTAKSGLLGLTRALATEFSPHGVRVNAIAPGFIDTPILQGMRPEVLDGVLKGVPLRRAGTADEIFLAVKFIFECDYFTGRCLDVDGGLVL